MSAPTPTCLLLAHQALDPVALRGLVPPGVRVFGPEPLRWQRDGPPAWTFDLPGCTLERLQEIVPCCCGPVLTGYRFVLEYELASVPGRHQAHLDPVGLPPPAAAAAGAATDSPGVRAEIDLLRIDAPLRRAAVRLVTANDTTGTPVLAAVSLRHRAGASGTPDQAAADAADPSAAVAGGADVLIDVPPRSQMRLEPALAGRVCSPTCVSMLLDHFGQGAEALEVIAAAHHAPSGLYGVWPANIQAAAPCGLMGFLLHFTTLAAVEWLLRRGVPVVASVRFEPGELAGAPIARSSGHLVLLCGTDGNRIIANDPAAPDERTVRRTYARGDLERVWLQRAAIGYVLAPAARLVGATANGTQTAPQRRAAPGAPPQAGRFTP
jgi:hypothetical protein